MRDCVRYFFIDEIYISYSFKAIYEMGPQMSLTIPLFDH